MNNYKELIAELRKCKYCAKDIAIYAADALEQIVAEYHKVRKQLDAAIACLPRVCGYCKHYNGLTCSNKNCRIISGVYTGWEWRG